MNRYYSLIHRIFNLALLWGKLPPECRNPAKGVAKARHGAGLAYADFGPQSK